MPVITISRQFGAGGKTLGEMVTKQLHYSFYDDHVIQMVAVEAKVSPRWVQSVETEAGGTLLKFISRFGRKSFLERITTGTGGYIDEEIYVDLLGKIISGIAKEGDAVILGRGSQYILSDFKDALHVLLIAERADRIRFMETHYGLSTHRAESIVGRQEKRRVNLYRKLGKQDYDQPGLYHLVLNTSKLSLEAACNHICMLAQTSD
jgi:cytidylate kinase